MAKRPFKLPGVEDLNKDQDRVLRLPQDGQFLIVGGPGTGKSVVTLLRTLKYYEKNTYVFMTYNKVLLSFTNQLVKDQLDKSQLENRTLTSVIYKAYWKQFSINAPEKEPYKPDYDQIIENFKKLDKEPIKLHLLIDEGQDMPPQFYEALMYLGIQNFFIVADQNQQITDQKSNRQELTDLLNLDIEDVIELKENFRNSRPIALLASSFYTDPSSPLPELPKESVRSLDVPVLFEYSNYHDCINLILREADNDSRNLIGVMVANNNLRNNYTEALKAADIELDNPKPVVSSYASNSKTDVNIDFNEGGIVVLNDKSVKGLEFDVVYIVIDGFQTNNNDLDSMKKRFYVMTSRAIKKLVLLMSTKYKGAVDQILPEEETILKRESI
jgi:superfamily I DNA/RNA helicase